MGLMIHWLGVGVALGIGFAVSSQTIYWALRRTVLHRESTKRLAREIITEMNRETARKIQAGSRW
jgi:hypothetical protein